MGKYTLDTDFSSLNDTQTSEWILEFHNIVKDAFANRDNRSRLLGNLLIMERYTNTLCQGLAANDKKLSLGLQKAMDLLWGYLENRIVPFDFQDFANDLYTCFLAFNIGTKEDEPEEFSNKYFNGIAPKAYENVALEWSSGLLLELISITGAHLEHEDFEQISEIDFYGINKMLHLLEEACIELTKTSLRSNSTQDFMQAMKQVHLTSLFQQIIYHIQKDLKTAWTATPNQFLSLRKEYEQYTIIPKEYATALLEY